MDPVSGVAYAVIDQAGQHVRASRLSGTTWTEVGGAATNLDGPTDDTGIASSGEQNTARTAVDASGNAVVAWPAKDAGGTGNPRVFVRRLVGATAPDASIEATVPSFAGHNDAHLSADMVNLDGGGSTNPWVVFRELFDFGGANNKPRDLARQLIGNSFGPAQVLDGLPNDNPTEGAEYPQIDINASGQGLSGMPRQLSFQAFGSQLLGGTWSTGFRLDTPTPTLAPFPTAAIADTGNGLLAWNDSSGATPQISARQDVGGVLGASFVLSRAGAGDLLSAPDAPIVASSSSAGTVAVGFGQSNGGNNTIVAAVVTLPQPSNPPPPKDTTAPTISRLKLSDKSFKVGSQLATFSRKHRKRTPVGTTITFKVSENSTSTFTFAYRAKGFKSGRHCVARKPHGKRKPKRCTRVAGRIKHATAAGTRKLEFEGRFSRHKKLKPGRYKLILMATDAAGNKSKAKTASFRVLKK
jgi:hypothetical protein